MHSWVERTPGKMVAGGPCEAADCGARQSRLQLASKEQLATLQGSVWQTLWSHICAQINREEQRGSETDRTTPGLQHEEIKPQTTD